MNQHGVDFEVGESSFCQHKGSHNVKKACEGPKYGIFMLNPLESADLACLLMCAHFSFYVIIEGLMMLNKYMEGQNREFLYQTR